VGLTGIDRMKLYSDVVLGFGNLLYLY